MLELVLEEAMRSPALGSVVWLGLMLLRVRDPRVHMTAWTVVLVGSLSMPLTMHWVMLTLPSAAPAARLAEIIGVLPGSPSEAAPAAELFSPATGASAPAPASATDAPASAPN